MRHAALPRFGLPLLGFLGLIALGACGGRTLKTDGGVMGGRDAAHDGSADQAWDAPHDVATDHDANVLLDGAPAESGPSDAGAVRDVSSDVSPDAVSPDAASDVALDGSSDRSAPGSDGSLDGATCPRSCSSLPHVLGRTSCNNGQCEIPPDSCQPGYRHCSSNPDDGCETNVLTDDNCGKCGNTCAAGLGCTGAGVCGDPCAGTGLIYCDHHCVSLVEDPANCGACGHACESRPGYRSVCVLGACREVCAEVGHADCTSEPGCETPLGTSTDCGGCGDPTCNVPNTLPLTCSAGGGCAAPICAPGYGNCDSASPDCEAPFGAANASCFPKYLGTAFLTISPRATPMAAMADGSYVYGGDFAGSVDLDPTSGLDTKRALQGDAFVTKLNANGTYAWTRTFGASGGTASVTAMAVGPDGSVVAAGGLNGSVTVNSVRYFGNDVPYVEKYSATGDLVFRQVFRVSGADPASNGSDQLARVTGIGVDDAGRISLAGTFAGNLQVDGTRKTLSSPKANSGFVIQLDATGAFRWAYATPYADWCHTEIASLATTKDGIVWVIGQARGIKCSPIPTTGADAYVLALNPDGSVHGGGTLGDGGAALALYTISASSDGSVYFAGLPTRAGTFDLDPGPGVSERNISPETGTFIVKLGADGAFAWARVVPGSPAGVAALDAGVIFAGTARDTGLIFGKVDGDGRAVFTLSVGGPAAHTSAVAASALGFALFGFADDPIEDIDPGTSVDPVPGASLFISRYAF